MKTVPSRKEIPVGSTYYSDYMRGVIQGWNDCVEALLAASPPLDGEAVAWRRLEPIGSSGTVGAYVYYETPAWPDAEPLYTTPRNPGSGEAVASVTSYLPALKQAAYALFKIKRMAGVPQHIYRLLLKTSIGAHAKS